MTTFNEFYHNKDIYKEYISDNVSYLLELSHNFNTDSYYLSGESDKLAEILALAAMTELKKGEFFNFYYIITNPRFNDTCAKELFKLFFKKEGKEKTEHVNDVFEELLKENFFNFSYIFLNNERENYCGYIKDNKNKLDALIKHLSKNKIYFYSLYNFLNGHKIKNQLHKNYINYCKQQKYLSEIMSIDYEHVHLLNREYVGEYHSEKEKNFCLSLFDDIEALENRFKEKGFKDKSKMALKILAIGFHFNYKSIIGSKKNIVERKNEIICYPDTPYYTQYPLCFNNPFSLFDECFESLSQAMKVDISEEEKIEISQLFNHIYSTVFSIPDLD